MIDKDCFYKRKSFTDKQWSDHFNIFYTVEEVLTKLSTNFKMDTSLKYDEYDLRSSKLDKEIKEYEEELKKCARSLEDLYSFSNL
jgi:hypothetical protein